MVITNATTEAREKISTYLEFLEFFEFFDVSLTKFENDQILLNKISNIFLATTKLLSGWKSLIAGSEKEKDGRNLGAEMWL